MNLPSWLLIANHPDFWFWVNTATMIFFALLTALVVLFVNRDYSEDV